MLLLQLLLEVGTTINPDGAFPELEARGVADTNGLLLVCVDSLFIITGLSV